MYKQQSKIEWVSYDWKVYGVWKYERYRIEPKERKNNWTLAERDRLQ